MKYKIKLVVLCCFLSVNLMGCLGQANSQMSKIDEKFLDMVAVADMNKSLQLSTDGDQKAFGFDSEIYLTMHNMSKYSVMFDSASPPKLYTINNGEWIEVKNEFTYRGGGAMSPKGKILLDEIRTSVKPVLDRAVLDSNQREILLRIVVICEIMEDDVRTGKLVGAYVDVILNPKPDTEL